MLLVQTPFPQNGGNGHDASRHEENTTKTVIIIYLNHHSKCQVERQLRLSSLIGIAVAE